MRCSFVFLVSVQLYQRWLTLLLLLSFWLFYVIDTIRVTHNAKSRFTKIENANYAVNIAKALSLSVVNVGGTDIVDGNKKMVLALTFQLMRK